MNDKNIISKSYIVFWFIITILTGILAGFLTSHSIMLGRYFTWLVDTGNYNVFVDSFSVFRQATKAYIFYNSFFVMSLIAGIIWTVFCFISRKNRIIGLIAGLSSLWVGTVFYASGFAGSEAAVCSGTADEAVRDFYAMLNIPIHSSFAVFYLLCFFLLLASGIRQNRDDNKLK